MYFFLKSKYSKEVKTNNAVPWAATVSLADKYPVHRFLSDW
jgi:hypothetical protein